MSTDCKICGAKTNLLLQRKMLRKYPGEYYKCSQCGFLQIFKHPWLQESYSSAITSLDIGLVKRNMDYAPRVKAIIDSLLKLNNKKYLDYGGGYGLFVRLMRDKGFDFYRYDTYCENLFAESFDYKPDSNAKGDFDLLTAFEVFEHISDPLAELEQMIKLSDAIFFSTELQPEHEDAISKWWYLMPEIGQHISFYSKNSLQFMASKFGYRFYTDGKYFHLFIRNKVSGSLFQLLTKKKVSSLLWFLSSDKQSLLDADYRKLLNAQATAS